MQPLSQFRGQDVRRMPSTTRGEVGVHEVPVVDATPETLRALGRLVHQTRVEHADHFGPDGEPLLDDPTGEPKPLLIYPRWPEFSATLSAAPDFLDYPPGYADDGDYRLSSNSTLRDAGDALTRVADYDSGGVNLQLEDAKFFQAGATQAGAAQAGAAQADGGWHQAVGADWLAVGSPDNVAPLLAVDRDSNSVTLAYPLTRRPGDPVWLARDSRGRPLLQGEAPDLGACEYDNVCGRYRQQPGVDDPAPGLRPIFRADFE